MAKDDMIPSYDIPGTVNTDGASEVQILRNPDRQTREKAARELEAKIAKYTHDFAMASGDTATALQAELRGLNEQLISLKSTL